MQKVEAELAKTMQELYKIQMAVSGIQQSVKDMRLQHDLYYKTMSQKMDENYKRSSEQFQTMQKLLAMTYVNKDK